MLFQIYTNSIISLYFDHYVLNRAYFPIQFFDLKHETITKSLTFNTYLSHSILYSEHFQIEPYHSILYSEHFQIEPYLKGNDVIIRSLLLNCDNR